MWWHLHRLCSNTALDYYAVTHTFDQLYQIIAASFHLDTTPIIFLLIVRPCYKHKPHGGPTEEKSEDCRSHEDSSSGDHEFV